MILYCCCHGVDDDTDSHASCSRSCFGSFIFIMKVSARDRRINGVVADLRGEEWINACDIRINVTANYLLRNCRAIVDALPDVLPPFGHAIVVINHGAVISYVGDVNEDNVFAGVHI